MAWRNLYAVGMVVAAMAMQAEEFMLYDFTAGDHGWRGNPRIVRLESTPEGLAFACSGEEDPWIEGPPVAADLAAAPVRLTLRLRTNGDGGGELFYGPRFEAGKSVRIPLFTDGQWHDYSVVIPPQPAGTRLRFDPGGQGGSDIVVRHIRAQVLASMAAPPADPPENRPLAGPELVSGDLRLRHAADRWGEFALTVAGRDFARSHGRDQLGYVRDKTGVFLPLAESLCEVKTEDGAVISRLAVADAEGVQWRLERRFAAAGDGAIEVTTTLVADRDREVFHLPWLTLFPGFASFGERKTQAILPGVEYLDDEPSSSEADVRGPLAERRLVDDLKLCFPFMALVHDGRYLGVAWNRNDHPAPLFDSPDRVFGSGAHVFGLWYPGVGERRLENSLAALAALPLAANQPLEFRYTLLAGRGDSAVAPVQAYVARRGLPPTPAYADGYADAVKLLARGWLDSAARHDGLWRHAVWGKNFPPQPAADAAFFQRWLATQTTDADLAARLRDSAREGLDKAAGNLNSGVSHVRFAMLPYLLEGGVETRIAQAADGARRAFGRFDAEGILPYQPREGKPNYAETHFANHANGLAAPTVNQILEACLFTGDPELRAQALALVDRQTALYANSVPRGAQTWECPLHTPDILASGRLVSMYTMAYRLSGEPRHLEQARYWAWTGLPFVYLDPPVEQPVGAYATIAVLGATNWRAPFWIGLPVQWCGLVYGAALADLAELDPANAALWRQVADGIVVSGLQQTWPADDAERQGLLPDYFHLRAQRSEGPAINPGTVGAHLPDAYRKGRIYQCRTFRNLLVHAPGELTVLDENRLQVDAWPETPYRVLLVGLDQAPEATWNGRPVPVEHHPDHRAATILLEGRGILALR